MTSWTSRTIESRQLSVYGTASSDAMMIALNLFRATRVPSFSLIFSFDHTAVGGKFEYGIIINDVHNETSIMLVTAINASTAGKMLKCKAIVEDA